MDKKTVPPVASNIKEAKNKKKEAPKKLPPEFAITPSTSHTKYFRKEKYVDNYERITTEEYLGFSESISGSSDTFKCVHGPGGKKYSPKALLKRNLHKELDPIPTDVSHYCPLSLRDRGGLSLRFIQTWLIFEYLAVLTTLFEGWPQKRLWAQPLENQPDTKWTEECPPAFSWEMAKTLEFMVLDTAVHQQYDRLELHVADFAKTASNGYKIDILDSLCTVLEFLLEMQNKVPRLRPGLISLLKNMEKSILMNVASDVITHFDQLRNYLGFLGYLLMRVEDYELFSLVSKGILYQMSAPDSIRGPTAAQIRHTLSAGNPVLFQSAVRMLAVADSFRFATFLELCVLIACDDADMCMEMMKENILENIFGRFNPYFPHKRLPAYEINPADPQDINVKLGECLKNYYYV